MKQASFLVAALLAQILIAGSAAGQAPYPSRPITIVVPAATGSSPDILGRNIAQKLAERWGTGAVVDNKPGASGNIGAELVSKAAPDGHTLLLTATFLATSAAIEKNLRHDPVKSFAPVVLVATSPMGFFVSTNTPVASVAEFVALAKSKPASLYYASVGNGSIHHLAMELFKLDTGIDIVHVPYKSSAGPTTDIIGGRVNAMIQPLATAASFVRSGTMKMLAVISPERSPAFPDVPTLKEAGYPNVQVASWYGLFVPAGTPAEVVARLNAEVNAFLALPDAREMLVKQGMIPHGGSPDQLATMLKAELARWPRVVAAAGIKPD